MNNQACDIDAATEYTTMIGCNNVYTQGANNNVIIGGIRGTKYIYAPNNVLIGPNVAGTQGTDGYYITNSTIINTEEVLCVNPEEEEGASRCFIVNGHGTISVPGSASGVISLGDTDTLLNSMVFSALCYGTNPISEYGSDYAVQMLCSHTITSDGVSLQCTDSSTYDGMSLNCNTTNNSDATAINCLACEISSNNSLPTIISCQGCEITDNTNLPTIISCRNSQVINTLNPLILGTFDSSIGGGCNRPTCITAPDSIIDGGNHTALICTHNTRAYGGSRVKMFSCDSNTVYDSININMLCTTGAGITGSVGCTIISQPYQSGFKTGPQLIGSQGFGLMIPNPINMFVDNTDYFGGTGTFSADALLNQSYVSVANGGTYNFPAVSTLIGQIGLVTASFTGTNRRYSFDCYFYFPVDTNVATFTFPGGYTLRNFTTLNATAGGFKLTFFMTSTTTCDVFVS